MFDLNSTLWSVKISSVPPVVVVTLYLPFNGFLSLSAIVSIGS